jgi:hypothetical protein
LARPMGERAAETITASGMSPALDEYAFHHDVGGVTLPGS